MSDPVNHPDHYKGNASCNNCGHSIECIDITRTMDFRLGNAVKYIWRHGQKNGLEDLEKAAWYLNHLIKELKGKERLNQACSQVLMGGSIPGDGPQLATPYEYKTKKDQ